MNEYTIKDTEGTIWHTGTFEDCQRQIIGHINEVGTGKRMPMKFKLRRDLYDENFKLVERKTYLSYVENEMGAIVGASMPRHQITKTPPNYTI